MTCVCSFDVDVICLSCLVGLHEVRLSFHSALCSSVRLSKWWKPERNSDRIVGERSPFVPFDSLLLLTVNVKNYIKRTFCLLGAGRKRRGCGSAFCFTGSQGVKKISSQEQLCKEKETGPFLGPGKEKEMKSVGTTIEQLALRCSSLLPVFPPATFLSESYCWSGGGVLESPNEQGGATLLSCGCGSASV